MKSKVTAPTRHRRANDIVLQLAHAEAELERTERGVRLAKGEYRKAKQTFREAKKAAKKARKSFRELSRRLKKEAGRKRRIKKLKTKTAKATPAAQNASASG